jgi:hypothetical protein
MPEARFLRECKHACARILHAIKPCCPPESRIRKTFALFFGRTVHGGINSACPRVWAGIGAAERHP